MRLRTPGGHGMKDKISRRSFLKVSAVTTVMAAMGLRAFAAARRTE